MSQPHPSTQPASTERAELISTEPWPELPTETEIYILPSGEVVVADLPAELAALITQIGSVQIATAEDAASREVQTNE